MNEPNPYKPPETKPVRVCDCGRIDNPGINLIATLVVLGLASYGFIQVFKAMGISLIR